MNTLQLYRTVNMATALSILESLEERLDKLEVTGDAGRTELEAEIRKCVTHYLERLIPSDVIFFFAKKYHINILEFGSDNEDWVDWVKNWEWDISKYQMEELFYIFTKPNKTKRCKQYSKA